MVADWPKANKKLINKKAEKEFNQIREAVIKIRSWKIEQKIPLSQVANYKLDTETAAKELIEKLAKVKLS